MSTAISNRPAIAAAEHGDEWKHAAPLAAYIAASALVAAVMFKWVTQPQSGDYRELAAPLWTMLVGVVCNASCAILGCYLVLRRMSLLGDAISHAVLPGIALGYLFSGSVAGLPILLGAMALGVLTSVLTH